MTKKFVSSVTSLLITIVVVSMLLPLPVAAVPQPPHVFRGTVTVGGSAAADGLAVTAAIAGASFSYAPSAQTSGGRYGDDLQFKVPADDPDTSTKEGGVNGDTVILYVEGVEAGAYTFTVGAVTQLSLSISVLPTLATPTNIQRTSVDNDSTPTFTWNKVTKSISYQVRIDTNSFSDIGDVATYTFTTVADGSHSFEVRGVDAQSTPGPSGTLLSFTIDTTPPQVALTALTPDPTTETTPTFNGTATDATATIASVEYRSDGGDWTAATAADGAFDEASESYTFTTSALDAGSHTVEVRATDAAGNIATTYASDTFSITTETSSTPTAGGGGGPVPLTTEDLEAMTADEAADAVETMTATDAAAAIEEMATDTAAAIIEKVDAKTAAAIIKKVDTDTATAIIEQIDTDAAAAIIDKVDTDTATAIFNELNTDIAAILINKVTTSTAAAIIENVDTGTAITIIIKVDTSTAAAIMAGVTIDKATAIMGQLSAEKLAEIIPAMSEISLMTRLPGLSFEKLYLIQPAILFASLPQAPAEQLVGERPPEVPAALRTPAVVYATPAGAEYLSVSTLAGEWAVVAKATTLPVETILIKTRQALSNVRTTLKFLARRPPEVPTDLPVEQSVLTYINIDFENAPPEAIDLGHLTFKVEKEWLERNSLHRWSVRLNRYDPELNRWISLPTKGVKEDDSYLYYTAVTTHFSTFAISGSKVLPSVSFKVTNFNLSPTEVKASEAVTISADVTNNPDKKRVCAITLWVNQTVEAGQDVFLDAGETKSVSFTVSRETAGSYEVRFDRLFGSFSVLEAAKPPTTQAPTAPAPAPPATTVPPPAQPVTPPIPTPTPPEVPLTTPVNWWLIGGITAVVIIIGVAFWFLASRRRD